ncbi:MAG: efflux RND transporter periplasmic adaptor subunit [candidate division Zixibacteria bacterium]|nr:efflux RND transporter periplasmic adaptor subunit [candidate division Zixibacteria bacterium]
MRSKAIPILSLILILLAGCGGNESSENAVEPERVAVETIIADYGSLVVSKSYSGTVKGIEQADLIAKLAETVKKVNESEGDRVKAGQVLLELDEGGPSSQYHQAEAVYENSKRLLKKYENLYEEGAVSENDLDRVETDFEVAKANFRAAKELVNVISPIDGEVTALNVNEGDQAYVGQHLATVGRRDSVRVEVGIDPADIDYVQAGDTVEITMQGANGKVVSGRIRGAARSANPDTRAFSVEIVANNKEGILKVGGLATARIHLYRLEDALLIPIESVLIQKGIPKVYRLEGDTAHSVEIEIGRSDGKNYEVLSGLDAGQEIVVLGKAFLDDGMLVNVTNREGEAQ